MHAPSGIVGSRLRIGACLSLSGRFARFGRQAAHGLQAWQAIDRSAELRIEDDASDTRILRAALPRVAQRSDVLLGPYSTLLMTTAGQMAADAGRLLWNHGGSGDDVEIAWPGHVISVLTPAGRYARPFLRHLAGHPHPPVLRIAHGRGKFGRQVAAGAHAAARGLGLAGDPPGPAGDILVGGTPADWALLTAGTFEDDITIIGQARGLAIPPRVICAVAAGVRDFGPAVAAPEGIFGIAQWFPGTGPPAVLGPAEDTFVHAYTRIAGEPPDYPAVQAAAAAALAAHCARVAGSTARDALWQAVIALDTTTLFGGFTIDPATGIQTRHQTVLVQWTSHGPEPVLA
jgi:ABC-type branched-subunit amino acid transport system substrate-binding protein